MPKPVEGVIPHSGGCFWQEVCVEFYRVSSNALLQVGLYAQNQVGAGVYVGDCATCCAQEFMALILAQMPGSAKEHQVSYVEGSGLAWLFQYGFYYQSGA